MKELVLKALKKSSLVNLSEKEIINLLEKPPSLEMGDYSFPCFQLAKLNKENPLNISRKIVDQIKNQKNFNKIESSGPYVNFFLDRKTFSESILKEINSKKEKYGSSNKGRGKKILIELSSPNIAKPFGIGHLRSTIIGNSLSEICKFNGFNTLKINYLGDWGTQFGKLIVGYNKWGNEEKLKKDPIKHLLDIYVKSNKKELEESARLAFKKLEEGDKEMTSLWKKFRELSLKEFEKIYSFLGIEFDEVLGESLYNEKMKEIVMQLEKKKLLEESQGAEIVNLEKFNLGAVLIKKTDGATLYTTRDLATAVDRYEKYKFNKMIYEVGQEQKLHFKQFFKVLELMGHKWAKDLVHVDHGLYLGKDGNKFSTRKGKTIFMEDIINEVVNLAEKEIKKRSESLKKSEIEKRAKIIALAAIFYGDLKNNRSKDIVFDLERFVSFEGNTGPYLLYSYARAKSILKKSKAKKELSNSNINNEEFLLLKKLEEFPEIVSQSYESLMPSLISNYSYQLSQIFNEFYSKNQVIDSDKESFRLSLVESFAQTLSNSLFLLGIRTLEEM